MFEIEGAIYLMHVDWLSVPLRMLNYLSSHFFCGMLLFWPLLGYPEGLGTSVFLISCNQVHIFSEMHYWILFLFKEMWIIVKSFYIRLFHNWSVEEHARWIFILHSRLLEDCLKHYAVLFKLKQGSEKIIAIHTKTKRGKNLAFWGLQIICNTKKKKRLREVQGEKKLPIHSQLMDTTCRVIITEWMDRWRDMGVGKWRHHYVAPPGSFQKKNSRLNQNEEFDDNSRGTGWRPAGWAFSDCSARGYTIL